MTLGMTNKMASQAFKSFPSLTKNLLPTDITGSRNDKGHILEGVRNPGRRRKSIFGDWASGEWGITRLE